MTLQAFHGDASEKARLIDKVRAPWAARQLLPATILKVDDENRLYSLCGALAGTQDIDGFVEKTGIPHELAMLCEALVSAGVEVAGAPGEPPTFTMTGPEEVFAFGLEWLEAIRPGADLSGVVPRFMAAFLAYTLSPGFALADHIEPASREVGEAILRGWRQELAGSGLDAKQWRLIRKHAQGVADQLSDPWGFGYRDLLESIAWPVRGLASEFVAMFRGFSVTWMAAIQQPFLDAEDQQIQIRMMKGWHVLAQASREHGDDEEATGRILDQYPEEKAAMMTMGDAAIRARVRVGRARAFGAVAPVLRGQMDEMLRLIRAA